MQFDVLDNSGTPPATVSLEVWNGPARMTFADGSMEVFFQAGAGASRISAEFRNPEGPNRSGVYTAVVRKRWAD